MLGRIASLKPRRFSTCPYRTLGVQPSASLEEIKQKFRELAKQFHPDVNKAPDASAKMAAVSAAYEQLSDGTYTSDSAGRQNADPAGAASSFSAFAEAFERMRQQSAARGSAGGAARGADVSTTLEISFAELFRLETKSVRVPRVRQTCGSCSGSGCKEGTRPSRCGKCKGTGMVRLDRGIMSIGIPCDSCAGRGDKITHPCGTCNGAGVCEKDRIVQVKIPAGVRNFMEIRLPSLGHAGSGEFAKNGDLYVTVKITQDPHFKILDDDIYLDLDLSLGVLLLGGDMQVSLPEGGQTSVKIQPGAKVGSTLTLKGKGLVKVKNQARGDLVLRLGLKATGKLTLRQQQLILEFDAIEAVK